MIIVPGSGRFGQEAQENPPVNTPDLHTYLDELRTQGSLDSHGSFTLDQARALEKLRRYQIDQPEAYALALVASAVAAGATRMDLECDSQRFYLSHNGRPFSRDELATLFSSLVVGGSDRRGAPARELATALNAISHWKPRGVKVISSDVDHLVHLAMDSKQLQVREDPAGGFESYAQVVSRTSVEIVGLRRPLLSRLGSLASGALPEVKLLRQRCRLSPVPIYLGGELLNPAQPAEKPLALALTAGARRLPLRFPDWVLVRSEEVCPDWEAALALVPGAASQVVVVLQGVSFELGGAELPAGVMAWIHCDHLRKDLSQRQLVRDDSYEQLLTWVRETVQRLVLELARTSGLLPEAADLLDGFALHYVQSWRGELAQQILPAVRRLRAAIREPELRQLWAARYREVGLQEEAAHYL